MSFFANLKTSWKNMSMRKKIQMAIYGACDIGGWLLEDLVLNQFIPDDTPKWKKAAMRFTIGGLGMAASNVAGKQINDTLDLIWKDDEEDDDE